LYPWQKPKVPAIFAGWIQTEIPLKKRVIHLV
jgi:hypothetical protein